MPMKRKKISPKIISEILNIVHNAIFLLDSGNRVLLANTRMAGMFKAEVGQLLDLDFDQLFMPDDRAIMAPNILKIAKKKREFETEAMLRRLDGTSFWGLISCAFMQGENEDFLVATIHDITSVKSFELMLKHSERMAFLGHMLDDISHQIRNPVQIIGGLARRLEDGGTNRKYVKTIKEESGRLEKLLDTLHAFLALPRPKMRQRRLAKLIKAADERFKTITERYGVKWECHYDDNQLSRKTMLIDLPLLLEALEAVVLNACEAYGEKQAAKTVTLQLQKTSEGPWSYAIRIIDHGRGIKADDLPHVVSHFFSKKTRHIGMGLTFAQRILEEQHGELAIDSTEGEGTTVTFFLKKERRRPIRTTKL